MLISFMDIKNITWISIYIISLFNWDEITTHTSTHILWFLCTVHKHIVSSLKMNPYIHNIFDEMSCRY